MINIERIGLHIHILADDCSIIRDFINGVSLVSHSRDLEVKHTQLFL